MQTHGHGRIVVSSAVFLVASAILILSTSGLCLAPFALLSVCGLMYLYRVSINPSSKLILDPTMVASLSNLDTCLLCVVFISKFNACRLVTTFSNLILRLVLVDRLLDLEGMQNITNKKKHTYRVYFPAPRLVLV